MGRIGTTELLIILSVALLIFGPNQLPKLGKTFGNTIRSFKDGVADYEEKNTVETEEV